MGITQFIFLSFFILLYASLGGALLARLFGAAFGRMSEERIDASPKLQEVGRG